LDPFSVIGAGGKHDGGKLNADTVTISKGELPTDIVFDPAIDTIIVNLDALTVVLGHDPETWKTTNQVYHYLDKASGISAKFDLGGGNWSLKMNKLDAAAIDLNPDGAIHVRLAILDREGRVVITTVAKTILQYRAPIQR
jgi:hypothetical protein